MADRHNAGVAPTVLIRRGCVYGFGDQFVRTELARRQRISNGSLGIDPPTARQQARRGYGRSQMRCKCFHPLPLGHPVTHPRITAPVDNHHRFCCGYYARQFFWANSFKPPLALFCVGLGSSVRGRHAPAFICIAMLVLPSRSRYRDELARS
jgi:hypothetical protein